MKKKILLFAILIASVSSRAQILGGLDSVNPNSAAQGQTLITTITQIAGSYLLGSPPCDNYGIFLELGADRIYSNYYNWQWMDIVDVEFTIPAAAVPGFYDVYVASAYYDWWFGTCTTIGYWMMPGGFQVTTGTGINDDDADFLNPVFYPNPVTTEGELVFNNKEGKNYEITVMDFTGRITGTEIINGSRISLATKTPVAGIYYYMLRELENGISRTGKFVIIE